MQKPTKIFKYRDKFLRLVKKGQPNSLYLEVNEYNEPIRIIRRWSRGQEAEQEIVLPYYAKLEEIDAKVWHCAASEVPRFRCLSQCKNCKIKEEIKDYKLWN